MAGPLVRLALTAGEPAGIGPELLVRLAQREVGAALTAVCDPGLLRDVAHRAGLPIRILELDFHQNAAAHVPGSLAVRPVALRSAVKPGTLDRANAAFVLESLEVACDACMDRALDGVVTAPLHKGILSDAGTPFSGHTEFFGERSNSAPLMLLVTGKLRVGLVTTHLPLARVPAAITQAAVLRAGRLLHAGLRARFGIESPRIAILGLNPHAGEGGHFGCEEDTQIAPAIATLRAQGIDASGPLAADTAFVPARLDSFDAVLGMYHDQVLPVLKYAGFGNAVNVTLGLPFVRTSVDHGVALGVAGTGRADASSLISATGLAIEMVGRGRSGAAPSAPRPASPS